VAADGVEEVQGRAAVEGQRDHCPRPLEARQDQGLEVLTQPRAGTDDLTGGGGPEPPKSMGGQALARRARLD
jgi:hypothetical protein